MFKVHHLKNSRSTRIIWLMEELGLDYELVIYDRDAATLRAPEALSRLHPLGKAPILQARESIIAESGAIIEYVIETSGRGRLAPKPGEAERAKYLELLHIAEGSAIFPIVVLLLGGMTGGLTDGLRGFVTPDLHKVLDYVSTVLGEREYLLESGFSGADIQMSYVIEAARMGDMLAGRVSLQRYLARLEQRPAYRRAIEKGGPMALAGDQVAKNRIAAEAPDPSI